MAGHVLRRSGLTAMSVLRRFVSDYIGHCTASTLYRRNRCSVPIHPHTHTTNAMSTHDDWVGHGDYRRRRTADTAHHHRIRYELRLGYGTTTSDVHTAR